MSTEESQVLLWPWPRRSACWPHFLSFSHSVTFDSLWPSWAWHYFLPAHWTTYQLFSSVGCKWLNPWETDSSSSRKLEQLQAGCSRNPGCRQRLQCSPSLCSAVALGLRSAPRWARDGLYGSLMSHSHLAMSTISTWMSSDQGRKPFPKGLPFPNCPLTSHWPWMALRAFPKHYQELN